MTIEWTRMLAGHQHVKGDPTIWVMRSGTEWCAGVRGLAPEPNVLRYSTSKAARAAVEQYMDMGLHQLPYEERLAHGSVA